MKCLKLRIAKRFRRATEVHNRTILKPIMMLVSSNKNEELPTLKNRPFSSPFIYSHESAAFPQFDFSESFTFRCQLLVNLFNHLLALHNLVEYTLRLYNNHG